MNQSISRKFSFQSSNSDSTKLKLKFLTASLSLVMLTITFSEYTNSTAESINFNQVKQDIIKVIEEEDSKRDDGTSCGPTLIRLAWHSSGTYSIFDKTGGSNGSRMRFSPESNWGANAGLENTRKLLEPIKKKYNISYSDLWTLAGVTAVEHMAGPEIPWKAGRIDYNDNKCNTKYIFDLYILYDI